MTVWKDIKGRIRSDGNYGKAVTPINASSESSVMVKQKDLDKEEKKREEMIKQEMKKRETIFYPSPFRGNSSGAPKINWNFVDRQKQSEKLREENLNRFGTTMPMGWTSKKVQKMTESASGKTDQFLGGVYTPESASGKTDQFLGGVYTPNVDKVWDANKQKWVDRSLLEKVMEETQSSKKGSPIEEKKPEEKKKTEPYVSYGISNPDRPKTWLEKFRIVNKVQLKPTFSEESGKKKYDFSFMNRKTKQQEEKTIPDSVTIGKHITIYDNNGKPVKTKSGKGNMQYGVGRPITNQSILKVREELAELTDKAGFEPIDWDLRDETGNMLNTNQVGLLRMMMLNEAGLI